jgi:hypothetical protein
MSSHRPRRLDRDSAEQLLCGAPAARREAGRLGALLRAAGAPVHPDELSGEHAALAAFQAAARLDPVPRPERRSMLKTALAKVLTVKAAIVFAGAGLGGVALAASADVLPDPLANRPAAPVTRAPATPAPGGGSAAPDNGNGPKATPSPSLIGLCRAYAARPEPARGRALQSPAFTALVTTAGGVNKVDDYCAGLAATPGAKAPRPAGRPTDRPDQASTKAPGGHPGKPASPPVGRPTSVPGGSVSSPYR